MTETVMLLLVGGRSATPAIMGALQYINDVNRVKFLLCTHTEDQYYTFQKNILRLLRGVNASLHCDPVQDVEAVDPNNFEQVLTAVTQLCDPKTNLRFVNLTSVPQPMAIAVYDYVTRQHPEALVFSVSTHAGNLIPLRASKKPQVLTRRLNVEEYIAACGMAVHQYKFSLKELTCTPAQAQSVARYLGENVAHTDPWLAFIRQSGSGITAPKSLHVSKEALQKQGIQLGAWADFMQFLFKQQLIADFSEDTSRFSYRLETAADHAFLYGGWLEYYVYLAAKSLGFDDVKIGIELANYQGEIDVLCVHQANPLICECKSGGYNTNDLTALESKAVKLGGRYCTRLFITTTNYQEDDKALGILQNRAAHRRIVAVTGNDLPTIDRILAKEMNRPTYARL